MGGGGKAILYVILILLSWMVFWVIVRNNRLGEVSRKEESPDLRGLGLSHWGGRAGQPYPPPPE